jgi:hypothetical protein
MVVMDSRLAWWRLTSVAGKPSQASLVNGYSSNEWPNLNVPMMKLSTTKYLKRTETGL